ncbi:F0F1 ATP synthase subunit delta [Taylorella equigenitalis]|uniref:ATP synthase subunit delta n=2 Tax=Taylorella equigenitalis TaxID=29575 RepID=I7IZL8_9BURK|nr:F0F1 ATP synthase subunit delta [Taylorella equigenitalis]AFN35260.1 ATP synthase subunit delta [Taylorella equigenitalis ATCC 35865]ASY29929.1 F0F1 ATP synthase subunit delta [Taylorella equigenitalis]ASY37230.1 F0F1 ATP synthase subunit delta [Taylorella equigenitalis]ASY38696.1 F0F1 ATP synthase subunit delta [Taylorella equigenitalis]ASY40221.1 F0F1 ATP synthase subunit delta [Taylorella equigenitalis]
MAELSTLARPYAEALFGVAHKNNTIAQWSPILEEMAQLASHEGVLAMLHDPKLSKDQRKKVFLDLISNQDKPKELEDLVDLLVTNSRIEALSEIADQYEMLKSKQEGSAVAKIISAYEISESQLNEIMSGLERKFGTKLKPEVVIDNSIIGGIRVIVGDQVLDSSVQAKLERLRESLVAQ